MNKSPINNQPLKKANVPAGRKINSPTRITPNKNFPIACRNSFFVMLIPPIIPSTNRRLRSRRMGSKCPIRYCQPRRSRVRSCCTRKRLARESFPQIPKSGSVFLIVPQKENNRNSYQSCGYSLNWFDNNDTVSNRFIWFHSKNETIKWEVKLSFGIETTLISLSNWSLAISKILF